MICGSIESPFISAFFTISDVTIFVLVFDFSSAIGSSFAIKPRETASITSSTLLCLDSLRFFGDLPLFNLLIGLLTELFNTGLVTLIGMSAVIGVISLLPLTFS